MCESVMVTKRILMLGGNRYNVRSIEAARAAGFFTLAADRNPQAPGLAAADIGAAIDLFDYDGLLAFIEDVGGIDGVVSMAEAGVRPMAHLSRRLGLASISEEAAANATSKARMRECWAASPYSVNFRVVNTETEALQAAAALGGFPLLLKPDHSFGGSRGVSRVNNAEEMPAAFAFAQSGGLAGSSVVVEQFIDGLTEHSAEVLIWEGRASVLCIGQKVKSPPPYRVDVSVQYPAQLTPAQEAEAAAMCQMAVSALGLTQGVAHVEFAFTLDGPRLFELGARPGGGHTAQIAQHVSGVDEFEAYCRMACGIPPEQFTPLARRGADYRFLVYPPGIMTGFNIPDAVKTHPNILDADITFAPGQVIQSLRTTSERAGFAVTQGDTFDEAVSLADWACEQVTVEYDDGQKASAYSLTDYTIQNPSAS